MESTFDFNGKTITIKHDTEETSCSFVQNSIKNVIEIIGASNNKKAQEISVGVVLKKYDSENNLITSERCDYLISNQAEYLLFYNIATVPNEGLGFTEYMHALNGATFRNQDLQERFFNADGTLKQY